MIQLEPGHTFDELAQPVTYACAMCRGRFPGPGVVRQGKHYCCDRCAAEDRHRVWMMLGEVVKYVGLAAVATGVGFLMGRAGHGQGHS